ncbi:MAG: hypothetical protein ACYDEY_10695 [Acidimicrobiales bacterium]
MRSNTRGESSKNRSPAIAYLARAVTSTALHGQEFAGRMLQTGRHRADQGLRKSLIALAVVLFGLGLAACTPGAWGPPPGTGDPGNVRLHQLRANPILSVLPRGAVVTAVKLYPAKWDNFYGGWSGMAVEEDFTTTEPSAGVISFYAAKAAKLGWHSLRTSTPVTPMWSKRLPGGDDVTLMLDMISGPGSTSYTLGTNPIPPPGDTYSLVASGNAILTTP